MSDTDQLAARAGCRCQGYWLLSRLFLEPPGAAFLEEVGNALPPAGEDSPDLKPDLDFLREAVAEARANPEEAAVAFTRHLVAIAKGSGDPLPWESQFLRGRAREAVADTLLQKISAWGYGAALALAAPPDHLGAELRLMAWLCNDERKAWLRGDVDAVIESLHRQSDLFYGHLAQWGPDYCRGLLERADNRYVKAIARISIATLEAEAELLNKICAQVDLRSLG